MTSWCGRRAIFFTVSSIARNAVWLGERYTTAWLNYYLRGQSQYFTYLYGEDAQADIQANRVTRAVQTAPQGVAATGQPGAIIVRWDLPAYSVIAGYNIYRGLQSGAYPSAPIASVGRVSSYLDQDTSGGNRFYYVVRSRDADGNEHQPSSEVSAVPGDEVGIPAETLVAAGCSMGTGILTEFRRGTWRLEKDRIFTATFALESVESQGKIGKPD